LPLVVGLWSGVFKLSLSNQFFKDKTSFKRFFIFLLKTTFVERIFNKNRQAA
jgi:hypothetical protein